MVNSSTLSSVQFVLREFSISLAWSDTWQPRILIIGLLVVHYVRKRLNERMYWHSICSMCIRYEEEKQQYSNVKWTYVPRTLKKMYGFEWVCEYSCYWMNSFLVHGRSIARVFWCYGPVFKNARYCPKILGS